MTRDEQIKTINEVLDAIRPFIYNDGGDVEFVNLTDDGIVQIRLLGACVGCGLADITVYQGIQEALIQEVEGIRGVELLEDNWI